MCRCLGECGAIVLLLAFSALQLLAGCASSLPSRPKATHANWTQSPDLTTPAFDPAVLATCDPPVGWITRPIKVRPNSVHQSWVSPSGLTAYGVIQFTLPLPVGLNLALDGFLAGMRRTEGSADLVEKQDDPNLMCIRFVANGAAHCIRANLFVDGFKGWTVYAGTVAGKKIDEKELESAIRARENTVVGKPESSGS
jgi:hypothetical protein